MKNKKVIGGIIIGVVAVAVIGAVAFFATRNKAGSSDELSYYETMSDEEILELAAKDEKRNQEYLEKTDTVEKCMAMYDKIEAIMGDTEDCTHRWIFDNDYAKEHEEEDMIKFDCEYCKKSVEVNALENDVWQDIKYTGEAKSVYLGRLRDESETNANVTFEGESLETEETTQE